MVIPAGARKIVIEENAPSGNIIAITDSSEKKFYLNGDEYAFAAFVVPFPNHIVYFSTEDLDGECNIGTSVGIYTHVEPKKEKLIINGPLKEDIVLFVTVNLLKGHSNIEKVLCRWISLNRITRAISINGLNSLSIPHTSPIIIGK